MVYKKAVPYTQPPAKFSTPVFRKKIKYYRSHPSELIVVAFKSTTNQFLSVDDIFHFVKIFLPAFTEQHRPWQKSLQQSLVANKMFHKMGKKSNYYALVDETDPMHQVQKKLCGMIKGALKHNSKSKDQCFTRMEICDYLCQHYPKAVKILGSNLLSSISQVLKRHKDTIFLNVLHETPITLCLWRMNPTLVRQMDEELLSSAQEREIKIQRAMERPERFAKLLRGKLKHGKEERKDFVPPQNDLDWASTSWLPRKQPFNIGYGDSKPPLDISELVTLAFKNSRSGRLWLEEIREFITKVFPYYRLERSKGLNGLIRDALENNPAFIKYTHKEERESRGPLWKLTEKAANEMEGQEEEQEEDYDRMEESNDDAEMKEEEMEVEVKVEDGLANDSPVKGNNSLKENRPERVKSESDDDFDSAAKKPKKPILKQGRPSKSNFSTRHMIAMALKNSPTGIMTITQICRFISVYFPYYVFGLDMRNTVKSVLNKHPWYQNKRQETTLVKLWSFVPAMETEMDEQMARVTGKSLEYVHQFMRIPAELPALIRGEYFNERPPVPEKKVVEEEPQKMTTTTAPTVVKESGPPPLALLRTPMQNFKVLTPFGQGGIKVNLTVNKNQMIGRGTDCWLIGKDRSMPLVKSNVIVRTTPTGLMVDATRKQEVGNLQPVVKQTMVNLQPVVNRSAVNQPVMMMKQTVVNHPAMKQAVANQPTVKQTLINPPVVNRAVVHKGTVNQTVVNKPVMQTAVAKPDVKISMISPDHWAKLIAEKAFKLDKRKEDKEKTPAVVQEKKAETDLEAFLMGEAQTERAKKRMFVKSGTAPPKSTFKPYSAYRSDEFKEVSTAQSNYKMWKDLGL